MKNRFPYYPKSLLRKGCPCCGHILAIPENWADPLGMLFNINGLQGSNATETFVWAASAWPSDCTLARVCRPLTGPLGSGSHCGASTGWLS
jgi:hypothetical protein